MAIRKFSASSLTNANSKSSKLWDQETTLGYFESIAVATITVAQSSVTFSNIPQNYSHLQVRFLVRSSDTSNDGSYLMMNFNGDTSAGAYRSHYLAGNGSIAYAGDNGAATEMYPERIVNDYFAASIFSPGIIDILDYSVAGKNRVFRSLAGYDGNGFGSHPGKIFMNSGIKFNNTNPVTSIVITEGKAANFKANSVFSLYGIRGA